MHGLCAIYKRELKSYFSSPIAYVLIAAFLAVAGYFFYNILSYFAMMSFRSLQYAQMYRGNIPPMNVNNWVIRPFFQNLAVVTLFLIPLLTMRSFAEERKSGTLELLITSPITNTQLLLGKFLAAYTLFLVMLLLTLVYQGILFLLGTPDFLPIVSGYIGFMLLGAAFVSLGVFISSLTNNQIVAALVSFALFLLFWVIDWASLFSGKFISSILKYLSVTSHFYQFARGSIETSAIVYLLSLTLLGLFLTGQSIESWKWRG